MRLPPGYPEIMSVAAVDWNGNVAGFSTRNVQVCKYKASPYV
jgi:hypothetical protein